MKVVSDTLSQLGVDGTFFYQLLIFLISFVFVYRLITRPHFKAYVERLQRTRGDESSTHALKEEIKEVEDKYQIRKRVLNDDL